MTEKPILFSGPMVRAILEGRKTATMRPLKPQPELDGHWWSWHNICWHGEPDTVVEQALSFHAPNEVGDLFWIREAWRATKIMDCCAPRELHELAVIWYEQETLAGLYSLSAKSKMGKLRPGIFLPKRFARPARLEAMAVEVARPRLLTATQIEAEGVDPVMVDRMGLQAAWQDLWENSYGHKSWQLNPWCWRYTFRLVRP